MSRPAAIVQGQPGTAEIGLATVAPKPARIVLAALRVVLGFYFLWAFVDKLFGFGSLADGMAACSASASC